MKTTGVVRRIDDLGRIVIPKEIRKTLRIKDGEYLQFFLENDNIVLQKYSPMSGLPSFYKDYVYSIQSEIGGNVIITDREKIIAVAGKLKNNYKEKNISKEIEEIIQNRIVKYSVEIDIINIVQENKISASYVVAPIITNGDAIGAVVILFDKNNVDDFIIKTGTIAAKFLGKCIE